MIVWALRCPGERRCTSLMYFACRMDPVASPLSFSIFAQANCDPASKDVGANSVRTYTKRDLIWYDPPKCLMNASRVPSVLSQFAASLELRENAISPLLRRCTPIDFVPVGASDACKPMRSRARFALSVNSLSERSLVGSVSACGSLDMSTCHRFASPLEMTSACAGGTAAAVTWSNGVLCWGPWGARGLYSVFGAVWVGWSA